MATTRAGAALRRSAPSCSSQQRSWRWRMRFLERQLALLMGRPGLDLGLPDHELPNRGCLACI
jgi:hypothetical protein